MKELIVIHLFQLIVVPKRTRAELQLSPPLEDRESPSPIYNLDRVEITKQLLKNRQNRKILHKTNYQILLIGNIVQTENCY